MFIYTHSELNYDTREPRGAKVPRPLNNWTAWITEIFGPQYGQYIHVRTNRRLNAI